MIVTTIYLLITSGIAVGTRLSMRRLVAEVKY
jgi:hypothetical protein